jgi:general secretion pathway protein D
LETIIIPEVNVRGAGVADVIEFLQTESQKVSGAENPINFVWQAPSNLKTAKVTLNLRNVPLADALKYVTEGVGLRYRVDAHAVVIYQPTPAMPTESSPPNVKSP